MVPDREKRVLCSGYDVWLDIHQKQDSCVYTLVPEDAAERTVFWTSSDPDIAEADEYGKLLLKAVGETSVTGALRSGISNTFILHVYDSLQTPYLEPEQIELKTPSLTLKQGEYSQVMAELDPKPNAAALAYSSEDNSVATVDYNGVVRAAGPGRTTLHVEAAGLETVPAAEVIVTVE